MAIHKSGATASSAGPSCEKTSTLASIEDGQLRQLREDVKKAVEKQRSGSSREDSPGFDVHEALKATFEILSSGPEARYSAQDQAEAFQTLANLLDLEALDLSQDEQEKLAYVLYDYWQSDIPNIHCRTLLDTLLGRNSESRTRHLVPALLRLLAQAFTASNKASIQILVAIVGQCSDEELEVTLPNLWDKLVLSLREQTNAVQASKILVKLSIRWYVGDISILASRLQPLLLDEAPNVRQTVFENLLPPLLTRFDDLFGHLSSSIRPTIHQSSTRLLSYLNLLRCSLQSQPSSFAVPDSVFSLLEASIIHADPLIRLEAMKLLIAMPGDKSTPQRIPLSRFALYRTFWTYNIQDSDSATFSTGLVGCWKAFILRCRTSSSAAHRDLERLEKQVKKGLRTSVEPEGVPLLAYSQAVEQFLTWWAQLAVAQLATGKPYRCQVNALKYLDMLLREGIDPDYQATAVNSRTTVGWPFQVHIVSESDFSAKLLHCFTSTYEDIKTTAFNLFLRCPLQQEQISSLRSRAFTYLKGSRDTEIVTGTLFLRLLQQKKGERKPEAISTEYSESIMLQELVKLSQEQLALASQDFAKAAATQPLHGCLSAIDLLLREEPNAPKALLLQCLVLVNMTWTVTRPYLSQDNQGDAEDNLDSESIVLSAAWRALKEVGDILCTVLCHFTKDSQWSESEVSNHALLYETWLLEIEHRGAVAHISNAYGRLCSTVSKASIAASFLARQWVESNLDKILLEERPMTRRSGGLPYLILGALCGSTPSSAILDYTLHKLLSVVQQDVDTPDAARFHALNILRVLFLDAKLSQALKPYLEQAFVVAVEGFGAEAWDVRNASLLLYAGLIQRVFGTKREHLPIHKRPSLQGFFSHNKRLHAKLLAELDRHQGSTSSVGLGSVFSALLLLSLLQHMINGPASHTLVKPFLPLVNACSASPVWKVREAAAAAITGLTAAGQTYMTCDAILASLSVEDTENFLHGKLLQVLQLIKTAGEAPRSEMIPSIRYLTPFLKPGNSPAVRTACLDIMLATACTASSEIIDTLKDYLRTVPSSNACAREATFQRTAARFLLNQGSQVTLPDLLQGTVATRSEALAYLEDQPFAPDQQHLPSVLQIMEAEHADLGNAAKAAAVLSTCPPQLLQDIDSPRVWRIYRGARAPFVKDAILPLLARLESNNQEALQQLWLDGILPNSQKESQSARMSSCQALSHLSPDAIGNYKHASLLVRLLQDEDMSIRHLAAATASKYYFDGQSVQSTIALDRVWLSILQNSTSSDANEMYEEALAVLDSLAADIQPQAGVLFAVEKTNVYIDKSVDQAWLSKLFSKHAAEIMAKQEDLASRLQQASEAVADYTSEERGKADGLNSYASGDLLEEAHLRLRTLSVVL